ncbi:MAG: hypothetical protein IKN53_07275 [Oscillibacter sp.]|nr:hypothetical protein [Oscillibacter sp.]
MKIYLAASGAEVAEAARYHGELAYAAYRIGARSRLLRENALPRTQGGLLMIGDRGAAPVGDARALCDAVLRECERRGAEGAVLDWTMPRRADLAALACLLAKRLPQTRRRLFVPESYAKDAAGAVVIVNTAVSGGNFTDYMRKVISRYVDCRRIALDVQCVRMDFTLPSRRGTGEPLGALALAELKARLSPAVFFSQDLCAHYFTYAKDGAGHFVLYDDAESLRKKLRICEQMGFRTAFFEWPEIRDFAGALFARGE